MFTRLLERPFAGMAAACQSQTRAATHRASSSIDADPSELSGVPGHILVVEHDPREQQKILKALRLAGHRVSLSAEGIEGFRRATALKPDLILLEVRTAVPASLATVRLLSANPSTSHIPVIFMTARATLEERLRCLEEGAVDCVQKPLETDELLMRVAVHLCLARSARDDVQNVDGALAHEGDSSVGHSGYEAEKVLVHAALRVIEADLANVPSLPLLAAQLCTHEKRLSSAFRAHTGQTVFEFVRAARLMRACKLLRESAFSIDEVAHAVGFSSAGNFSTSFRARFGCTPSTYRKQGAGLRTCIDGER
ncbi:helix-turn-helix domain-containing protein [Pararhizobium sp.]|uniref:helix-turn-helix domain-containing protein n=1 Tax=Pararhizobium sp. TaxID=1977563 RepID=UPI002715D721|nr:helix-turn-helix domain-containing protein [Pararhizobium sp.]MDO9415481.1 helix-turn-helix domain-containing protein [Pararhizobium sp.]